MISEDVRADSHYRAKYFLYELESLIKRYNVVIEKNPTTIKFEFPGFSIETKDETFRSVSDVDFSTIKTLYPFPFNKTEEI